MTTTPPDPTEAASAAVPPPGCPAHGLDADGIARLYGPEYESDAMGVFERLRKEHGPVAPVLLEGDLPAWLVLGYRENLHVARTPTPFSRDSRLWSAWNEGSITPDSQLMPVVAWQPVCCFVDGEEHERLRAAVTDSIKRFDRRGIRRHVTRFANQLIDNFVAEGKADLVTQFAEPLPMLVMARLCGLSDEHGPRLVDASRDLIKGSATAQASNEYVVETLVQLVKRKREAPGHDLTSWLVEHPAGLSDDEVMQHLRVIMVAAHETTTNLMANTLRMVLTDRRFRASLAGGHMTLPDAVEQVLWDEPPFQTMPGRYAINDTQLAGQPIKAGDMVLLGLAAGNVDPAIRPDRDAPMHGNRSHLAFSGGPHECPGQDIGRAITDTAIDTLLATLPDIVLAVHEDELQWDSALLTRRLVKLPVEFSARQRQVAVTETGTASQPPQPTSVTMSAAPSAGDPTPERPSSWWRSLKRLFRAR